MRLQARLGVGVDGILGPVSYAALFNKMAGRNLGQRATDLGKGAAHYFPVHAINSPLRIAHFLAQAAAETGDFRYMREIWGPTDAQRRYEGRADLGNCIAGDGKRFLGRGIFQITGRDNYQRFGQKCGIDLACSPDLAEFPETAVQLACLYWTEKRLNQYADADSVLAVSNGINRGNPASIKTPNGYEHRKAALKVAKGLLL